jgi:hypothetical protein
MRAVDHRRRSESNQEWPLYGDRSPELLQDLRPPKRWLQDGNLHHRFICRRLYLQLSTRRLFLLQDPDRDRPDLPDHCSASQFSVHRGALYALQCQQRLSRLIRHRQDGILRVSRVHHWI